VQGSRGNSPHDRFAVALSASTATVQRRPRDLHRDPPLTVAGVLLRYPWTLPAIIALFAAMAVSASVADGALLRVWDEPIRSWVTDNRTDALDTFFLNVTDLGNWKIVVIGLIVLLALAWRTCAPMAALLLVATLARPVCEWLIKGGVGRERPSAGALVEAGGPSFPSGHVLAAVALWGLVPPVVALVTHRRTLWWIATIVSGTIILLVAASRVYMGVHWFSDVVGGLLFGAVFLLLIEYLGVLSHRRYPCSVYFEPPTPSETPTPSRT
jgi:undecaprenyl-diphosphatase